MSRLHNIIIYGPIIYVDVESQIILWSNIVNKICDNNYYLNFFDNSASLASAALRLK